MRELLNNLDQQLLHEVLQEQQPAPMDTRSATKYGSGLMAWNEGTGNEGTLSPSSFLVNTGMKTATGIARCSMLPLLSWPLDLQHDSLHHSICWQHTDHRGTRHHC